MDVLPVMPLRGDEGGVLGRCMCGGSLAFDVLRGMLAFSSVAKRRAALAQCDAPPVLSDELAPQSAGLRSRSATLPPGLCGLFVRRSPRSMHADGRHPARGHATAETIIA